MAWVKLDDGFFMHPKVVRAGRDARDLYLAALCYCQAGLTDGLIDTPAMPLLAVQAGITGWQLAADRLIAVGLWERIPEGFRVHDYLDWNPPSEQIKRDREAAAERMRRLRSGETPAPAALRSAAVRPNMPRTNGERSANFVRSSATPPPDPVPVPDPPPDPTGRAGDGAAAPDSAAPPPELRDFHDLLAGCPGYEPTAAFFAKVAEKYGGLDLVEEAEKLRSWLREHPRERCSTRRVLNWLQGAEERTTTRGKGVNGHGPTDVRRISNARFATEHP